MFIYDTDIKRQNIFNKSINNLKCVHIWYWYQEKLFFLLAVTLSKNKQTKKMVGMKHYITSTARRAFKDEWETEGRYRCTKYMYMAMAPFWFSTEHNWMNSINALLALGQRYLVKLQWDCMNKVVCLSYTLLKG